MNIDLTPVEARVLGCLLEKAVTTPDHYPLTLNALVNACNQKSSRDPVMSLDQGEVERTVRMLRERRLVTTEENFKSRVEKFDQRFCNTLFADVKLDSAQYAVMCLLLLRGPQTPGELRTRAGRLHEFADNQAVAETLQTLIDRPEGALVARMARKPGRQDNEYAHLLSGDVESVAQVETPPPVSQRAAETSSAASLEARVAQLEVTVAALEQALAQLRSHE